VRIRWPVWVAALGIAVVAGVTVSVLHQKNAPAAIQHPAAPAFGAAASWAEGERKAPDFSLTDQRGAPVSIARMHGRPAIVTFIDPLCRDLCPLEAKVLMQMVKRFPAGQRPAIISVSVNPPGDTRENFALVARHWGLGAEWYWAAGPKAKLAEVWRKYQIGVQTQSKVVAGVKVVSVLHTEGSYVIDKDGYERALYLYPFQASDIEKAVHSLD
jgi:cytochrome oxidase Cu insertion factor (SCO1/SenC/PrrC family)